MSRFHFIAKSGRGLRVCALSLLAGLMLGQAQPAAADPTDINARIRKEEAEHSQIAHTLHYLADVYGPQLTGSPNARAAGEWAASQMTAWGMQNAHLEPWLFGHPGWTNEFATGSVTSPLRDQLFFRVLAWTPGTPGPIAASAVLIDPPPHTTKAQLQQYLQSVRGPLKGRIVMVGKGAPAEREVAPEQMDEDFVAQIRRGWVDPSPPDPPLAPDLLTSRGTREQIDAFLIKAGALMRVDDAQEAHGEVRAFANFTYDIAKSLPTVELRNEDYGRLARLLADGAPVKMRFDIRNQAHPGGRVSYNTVAEIPGTDKKDEVVVIGAHLNSWHSATGAVDDGVGCAMMMEAGRILLALGVHPRRTIRIVLWTGEEQYLLGSQDYVARHFGTAEAPGSEFSKLAAYVNIDGGTGRIRGANMFGPPEDAAILRELLKPFSDLGVEGAIPHTTRRLGSTDATTFSRAGLPSIGLMQNPLDYHDAWHSDLDTYERLNEDQAKQAATLIAAMVYGLAMRDQSPPRFSTAAMPAPIGPAPQARPLPLADGHVRRWKRRDPAHPNP